MTHMDTMDAEIYSSTAFTQASHFKMVQGLNAQ